MDIPTHAELVDRIEKFCARHDMAESTFGRLSLNNPGFVGNLRGDNPRSPTLDTLNKLAAFMAAEDVAKGFGPAPALPSTGEGEGEADSPGPFSADSRSIYSSTIAPPSGSADRPACPCSSGSEA